MSTWRDLSTELDRWAEAGRAATFWWRDDDAVAASEALERLIATARGAPIALSVMPALAERSLATFVAAHSELTVVQHGWTHQSHLPGGNSEYPPDRPAAEVEREFVEGYAILRDLFGLQHVPAFTPPWHRFHPGYAGLLRLSGTMAISLVGPRPAAEVAGMKIVNVHCSPIAWTEPPGFRNDETYLQPLIEHLRGRREARFPADEATGIVTHHLVQNARSHEFLARLVDLIASHAGARWLDLREIIGMARERAVAAAPAAAPPLPAILISFNRGPMLRQVIGGLRGLRTPLDIVIHDNGSADPTTLQVLKDLEIQNVRVFRRPAIKSPDDLNRVDETVQEIFGARPPGNYIVSDDDIDLSDADPRAIEIYAELLARFDVECVGPMLRIADVPRSYPLYNHMMNRHIAQFWSRRPRWVETAAGRVGVLDAPIDTTFALHRASGPFCRLKRGLRVYAPYDARHLDWYPVEAERQSYRDSSSPAISHWNNALSERQHRADPLHFDRYFAVRAGANGPEEHVARP
jgi:hypothetical protein